MKRIPIRERADWQAQAEAVGFDFHTIEGEPYWDESAYYQFSLAQIENDIEDPTADIHQMAMQLVDEVVHNEALMAQLDVPERYWNHVVNSWKNREPHLYGRMDLAYNGNGPAKLLELNYDTPTSLFETGYFQWMWLEQQLAAGALPSNADQFNSLQDQLENAFKTLPFPTPLHFTSVLESIEDKGTVHYLMDIASQCGIEAHYLPLENIGEYNGQFIDEDNLEIRGLFKLYPWEFMLREDFGQVIITSQTQVIEPPWKMLLSNKGILPLLWQRYPDHPNLLPAFFEENSENAANRPPLESGWVRKPLFSREGANIEIKTDSGESLIEHGPYGDISTIRQAFCELPRFERTHPRTQNTEDTYAVIGSWVVGDEPAGMGIREDSTLITKDSSRFVPHCIVD
ncbi:MAG TPA: glutathionylspermidine synthase family protein [Marinagarivorans sp.]